MDSITSAEIKYFSRNAPVYYYVYASNGTRMYRESGVTSVYAMDRKNGREGRGGANIWTNSKIPSISPVHSRSRDIRRALSWRYASCGRRDMLILCAFITRAGPGVFYFYEVLRPVNTLSGRKFEGIFFNGRLGRARATQ